MKTLLPLLGLVFAFLGCKENGKEPRNVSIDEISGSEEVKEFMETFNSLGIQSDSTQNISPQEALKKFDIAEDLQIELVLSEPRIHQPVDISFDHRGRLWVVQYNQYPYPEGVKVTDIDRHNRTVFNKIPKPPPEGVKGADRITIFEDTDKDGLYDKSIDAITGLNITTGVALGRKRIWVLTPPYLVAYPDSDDDGLPDGKPKVHLEGFGLEDTHAVANNLRWGPDGWLYGAQGSTTTANVNSEVSKNVYFSGQGIWRYHPETKVFEIFAEGGGNTFDVEFDAKGRVYSGDNGTARGFYYKQGGYYQKNWGKHGALTNPYAFGFLPGMELEGEKFRFTHAWIKYEEATLPKRYQGKIWAINPLHNFVRLTRMEEKGSSFLCIDEEKILESADHWFRPVDIKSGPDGAVYIADWNDSRMSHVDPRDTWSKTTGRIYKLRGNGKWTAPSFDLSTLTNSELVQLLSDKNKWFRQEALRQFGDRKDSSVIPELETLFRSHASGQTSLEALWAIHLTGGFSEKITLEAMDHTDPHVRLWAIRLIGDTNQASNSIARKLREMALSESHLEVLGQLASTAKRLPQEVAVPIIAGLLENGINQEDIENQMFTWWALESKTETGRKSVLELFNKKEIWDKPLVKDVVLERLIQRYALKGGNENYTSCIALLNLAPSDAHAKILFTGLQEGLRGRDPFEIPTDLAQMIQKYQSRFGEGKWALPLRRNETEAVYKVLELLPNKNADRLERLAYIKIFGEINQPKAVPVLLQITQDHKYSIAVRIACLEALGHYNEEVIGREMAEAYLFKLRADLDLRKAAFQLFASRASWASAFLVKIGDTKEVKKSEVPLEIVRQFKLLGDSDLTKKVDELWPNVKMVSSEEKEKEIKRVQKALVSGTGNVGKGKNLYGMYCASCHILDGEGKEIGPELTGYDRNNLTYMILNIVDPNADIREGYVNYRVKKKDGQVIVGLLTDRSAGKIKIKPLGMDEITLATGMIDEIEAQKASIMPERLLAGLSEQDIRDLFAYMSK
ncbi:PVC-type heme-binding CxxCH protein [Ulvibacterium sp.]|uniref:PVC-type heme-binding CxxCH protein n=1 Tax=Ulvibacterium sp. TaxID=2665914 RepID=UPI003BAAF66A